MLIEAGVGGFFEFGVIEDEREGPAADLLGGFGMDDVEDALRLIVVHVLRKLPAFDDRAAIGNFHAVQIILNHDVMFRAAGFRSDGGGSCSLRLACGSLCRSCT